jgi:hypothetical protein
VVSHRDFRARSDADRLAAYKRGGDWAHPWLALNTGRTVELRGGRALGLLATIREESRTVLALNPSSVEGLILAGGLASELPPIMAGDDARAEALLIQALELDPHHTGGRLELARLYLDQRRWRDAQRELLRVVEERAPTDLPRWTVSERPRARELLADLYARGRVAPPPQAPVTHRCPVQDASATSRQRIRIRANSAAVTAVAHEARLAALAGALQDRDDVTTAQVVL